MKNFEFEHNGQKYWYSRANVCVTAVFCLDRDYNLCVLVNKRGTATDNENHKWNLPVGYLDFDETLKQCAAREVFEETGVRIQENKLKLYNINSKPDGGNQDIGFRYYIMLEGFTEDYKVSMKYMEKNEVESIMWLPIQYIDEITWAWNHKDITKEISNKFFRNYIDKELSYDFICDDGVMVTIYANNNEYGIVDYKDCSNTSHKSHDTVENNWIKAYESSGLSMRPKTPTNVVLMKLLAKCKKLKDKDFYGGK